MEIFMLQKTNLRALSFSAACNNLCAKRFHWTKNATYNLPDSPHGL
jgi:hypothetical protein